VLHCIRHPGIVQMHGTFADKNSMCLVLDYALNNDFSSFLEQKSKTSNSNNA
jgi:hypothetical protein